MLGLRALLAAQAVVQHSRLQNFWGLGFRVKGGRLRFRALRLLQLASIFSVLRRLHQRVTDFCSQASSKTRGSKTKSPRTQRPKLCSLGLCSFSRKKQIGPAEDQGRAQI